MNREQYLTEITKINKQISELNNSKQSLKEQYVESNRPYPIGTKVLIYNPNRRQGIRIAIVSGYSISFDNYVDPTLKKTKRDGTISKVSTYRRYSDQMFFFEPTVEDPDPKVEFAKKVKNKFLTKTASRAIGLCNAAHHVFGETLKEVKLTVDEYHQKIYDSVDIKEWFYGKINENAESLTHVYDYTNTKIEIGSDSDSFFAKSNYHWDMFDVESRVKFLDNLINELKQ